MSDQQQYAQPDRASYSMTPSSNPTATAIINNNESQQNVAAAEVYTNPYVYMDAQAISANFFQPAAYFPTTPTTLDLNMFWAPWSFEIHGSDLNSPLVDYSTHPFPGTTNSQLHGRLPPLQSGLVPTDFPLQSFMTRSSAASGSAYGTRAQATGRKGGRRPREIEDREQHSLNNEEISKRNKRRERNKEAAARCRKRRLELMETLQLQVDKLKDDNRKKQEIINQLLSQQQKYSDNFRHDDCKLKLPIRHLANDDVQQQQQMMYNSACEMIQHQSMQLKMENDNSNVMQSSEMESLYKEDQLGADRSSPASTYPNTTSSMMLNDPVISHAAFQQSSNINKRNKHAEENEIPAFSRPTTLSLATSQFGSSELSSSLPSITTPSNGLGGHSGYEFNLLHQQTFLTPMTLGPVAVTTSASTPMNGELRQL